MGEPAAQPGAAAQADPAAGPAGPGEDAALDEALRELFTASRKEDRGEPREVLMSWYPRLPGLL